MGVRSVHMDTDLGSFPPVPSPAPRTYGTALGHLAYMYCPFLYIEMGGHGGGFHHIWILSLCKRISHPPDGMSAEHYLPWEVSH